MIRPRPDLLPIIEALYRVEQPREAWIDGLQEAAAEVLGAGLASVFYDISSEHMKLDAVCARGISPAALDDGRADHTHSEYTTKIRTFYRTALCERQAVYAAADPEFLARMASYGIRDAVCVNGLDPSGIGVATYLFSHDQIELSQEARDAFERVAVHTASAYRLQRRLSEQGQPSIDTADARFNARGKLEDLREPLARDHLDDLKRALAEREQARREQPRKALARWKVLVQGRWTLVDHFERDGKQYIVAVENTPKAVALSQLSEREQQVAALAALGRSNKVIAYELGISHSTVRVLLWRACARLGVQSRAALVDAFNANERS